MQSLFQEKDYLNGRFFHKRAFYIATIAAAIKKDKSVNVDVSYHSPNDDPRLTSVVLTHRNGTSIWHSSVFCRLPYARWFRYRLHQTQR